MLFFAFLFHLEVFSPLPPTAAITGFWRVYKIQHFFEIFPYLVSIKVAPYLFCFKITVVWFLSMDFACLRLQCATSATIQLNFMLLSRQCISGNIRVFRLLTLLVRFVVLGWSRRCGHIVSPTLKLHSKAPNY